MKPTKLGEPLQFAAPWKSIVGRIVAGCDEAVLADAMKQSLLPFSLFRDTADVDLHVLMQRLTVDDLRRALSVCILWLESQEHAFDRVFAQPVPEASAAIIFRRPLEVFRHLLADLRDGNPSRWTDLVTTRAQGDRTDSRQLKEYKDQAFRTYKLLLSIGASAADAVEAINKAAAARMKSSGLAPLGALTADTLRRRSSRVRCFDVLESEKVLSRSPIPISELRSLGEKERKSALQKIASIALINVLDDAWSRSRK
jgi:hypothetical protein